MYISNIERHDKSGCVFFFFFFFFFFFKVQCIYHRHPPGYNAKSFDAIDMCRRSDEVSLLPQKTGCKQETQH